MPEDEAKLLKAVREAAVTAHERLGQAREQVTTSLNGFNTRTWFFASTTGEKVRGRKDLAAKYRALRNAVKVAEKALAAAERASTEFMRAAEQGER